MNNDKQDYITPLTAKNLSDLFYERVKRSSSKVAYRYFDKKSNAWQNLSWQDIADQVARWHTAFRHEKLIKGDRVAIMMSNSPDWVIFDQAAYSLGLVVVPIYTNDRAENIRYILQNANVKIFFIEDPAYCKNLFSGDNSFEKNGLIDLKRIITPCPVDNNKKNLVQVKNWLPSYTETIERVDIEPNDLATIVYTSGTTGRPKGVMLSHNNIFSNTYSAAIFENFDCEDVFFIIPTLDLVF